MHRDAALYEGNNRAGAAIYDVRNGPRYYGARRVRGTIKANERGAFLRFRDAHDKRALGTSPRRSWAWPQTRKAARADDARDKAPRQIWPTRQSAPASRFF